MRGLVIGDIHGEVDILKQLLSLVQPTKVSFVILVGDIGLSTLSRKMDSFWVPELKSHPIDRYIDSLLEVFTTLDYWRGSSDLNILYVHGNHDFTNIEDILCERKFDLKNLHFLGLGESMNLGPYKVAGWGAAPARVAFPSGFSDENDLEMVCDVEDIDLLIAHCPPFGYLDGERYGSSMIRNYLDTYANRNPDRPLMFVCGHIHESLGILKLPDSEVLIMNTGSLGYPYPRPLLNFIDLETKSFYQVETNIKC